MGVLAVLLACAGTAAPRVCGGRGSPGPGRVVVAGD